MTANELAVQLHDILEATHRGGYEVVLSTDGRGYAVLDYVTVEDDTQRVILR